MARILVVDDEPLVRDLYSVWLEGAGHQVRSADTGAAGKVLLEHDGADVLLTDIRMTTATDGIDLLAWTRQHDPTLSVILITGVPEVNTVVEALRLAAYDYLVKPVPQASLLHTVSRAAEYTSLQRERARLTEENQRFQAHLQQLVKDRTMALERRTSQLLLLNQVVSSISALQESPEQIFQRTVSSVQAILGYRDAAIFEIDRARRKIVLKATASPAIDAGGLAQEMDITDIGLWIHGDSTAMPLTIARPKDEPAGQEPGALGVFPISVGGLIRYALIVPAASGSRLDRADTTVLLTLIEHLSVALANSDLFGQLRKALQVREQILQNVSHELRTPLTLISGYAELLAESDSLDAATTEMLAIINEQTHHLGNLVNQLLSFQTIERESLEITFLPVGEWLDSQVMTWDPVLALSGLRLESNIHHPLGIVQGNWGYLDEVMHNLMDNARKFSPEGGVVTVAARHVEQEVWVTVSDQGTGVSPEKIAQLFDRFYQADGGVTRRFGGMGLGLALVKEIINAHHGRVWAESPGRGDGFTVTFALPIVA